MRKVPSKDDPVVITGIGMIASVGHNRESVWRAVRNGECGIKPLTGLRGIPDGECMAATVNMPPEMPQRLKVFALTEIAAEEAMRDSKLELAGVDLDRFGCSINSHMGDSSWLDEQMGLKDPTDCRISPWWHQFLPNASSTNVANRYGLVGPRVTYSTACASSLVSILSAERMIRDGRCDLMLAGGADALDPLFVAGFRQMRVLAKDGECQPFDRNRHGFVLGEGGAMFVLERASHAVARGAKIYAQIRACKAISEAHHVTSLDAESEGLSYLISTTVDAAGLRPSDIGYINAHGTGTEQNDLVEMRGIRRSFGPAVDDVCVSSIKSMLGHMINGAGGVELAITALAMRDGFAPPTINLTDPDPECTFDCLPMAGRPNRFQHALKLSVAFGGHLVAIALSRWNDAKTGFSYPAEAMVA